MQVVQMLEENVSSCKLLMVFENLNRFFLNPNV